MLLLCLNIWLFLIKILIVMYFKSLFIWYRTIRIVNWLLKLLITNLSIWNSIRGVQLIQKYLFYKFLAVFCINIIKIIKDTIRIIRTPTLTLIISKLKRLIINTKIFKHLKILIILKVLIICRLTILHISKITHHTIIF